MATSAGPFDLVYDTEVLEHLAAIDRKHHALIRRTLEGRLRFEPLAETRNRKPLIRPSVLGDAWELRFGPRNEFRVFYTADPDARRVLILAVGVKTGNRLKVGGKEFDL